MRSPGVPSRTGSTSPDNTGGTSSKRSSWGRSRRTFMACTECRRRQVKCTPSDLAGQACERCAKRRIKCEFMSIQEQKHVSTPDDDESSASVTLHLPQYGGTVGGMSCSMPTGPILGDPADVRQGILGAPPNHPLVRPTGMPIPAPDWAFQQQQHHHQHHQQSIHPSVQAYHRPGTPSWNPQGYPQPPAPVPGYQGTPTRMTPTPRGITPVPAWHPVGNSQSQSPAPGYHPPLPAQIRGSPAPQWKDPQDNNHA